MRVDKLPSLPFISPHGQAARHKLGFGQDAKPGAKSGRFVLARVVRICLRDDAPIHQNPMTITGTKKHKKIHEIVEVLSYDTINRKF